MIIKPVIEMEDGLHSYSHPKLQLALVGNMAEEADSGSKEHRSFSDRDSRCRRRSNTAGCGPILDMHPASKSKSHMTQFSSRYLLLLRNVR